MAEQSFNAQQECHVVSVIRDVTHCGSRLIFVAPDRQIRLLMFASAPRGWYAGIG